MKKIFALLFAAIMCFSFVGCGQKAKNVVASTQSVSNNTEKTTVVAGKTVTDADVSEATKATSTDKSGFTYSTSGDKITVTGYSGSKKDIVIPEKINNKNVVAIGENAFTNSSITSVKIGNNVKEICAWSFENCKNLKKIDFGTGVEKIDELAFWDCFELTSVVIPKNVTYIGQSSFFECIKLVSVTIKNPSAKIEKYAFGYYNVSKAAILGGMTIYGAKNSTANKYATSNKIAFEVK